MKVLVATDKPFAKVAVDEIKNVIQNAGYSIEILEKYGEQSKFVKAAEDVDAIIVRSDIADKSVIDSGKHLKIIVRAGAGYDNVDLKAASEKGIVVMNTPGQNSNAVAELAIAMMIYISRNLFNGTSGTELKGKTLGLHAFGNVAKYVAQIAKGFRMDIYAYDPFIPSDIIEKDGVKPVKFSRRIILKVSIYFHFIFRLMRKQRNL